MSDVHVKLRVGREAYALPVESVREVGELTGLTNVPGTGKAVLGVLNSHGQVLPVFDSRRDRNRTRRRRIAHRRRGAQRPARRARRRRGHQRERSRPEQEAAELGFLRCAVLEDGQLVGVVDVGRMFESLERKAT